MGYTIIPREMRTFHTEAEMVFAGLADLYEWMFPEKSDAAFYDEVFGSMWRDATTSGDSFIEELPKLDQEDDANKMPMTFAVALIACAFLVQAMKAESSELADKAWPLLADAKYWLGLGEGLKAPVSSNKLFADLGRLGGMARHAKSERVKERVIGKYRQGKWPSANQAAHALKDDAVAYAKAIGATLSEQNAQRTIAEWIRKSN